VGIVAILIGVFGLVSLTDSPKTIFLNVAGGFLASGILALLTGLAMSTNRNISRT